MDDRFAQVKAIVFDLDDTLCAYWDASKAGLRAAFVRHPVPGKTPEEMIAVWGEAYREFGPTIKTSDWYNDYLHRGEPTRTEQMRRTLARVGVKSKEHARLLSETYAKERNAALALFEESLEVLTALKGKYRLALLTNGPADIQRQEIDHLGLESFFDCIFIEGEMKKGKPSASVFRRVAGHFKAEADEMLMVGNSYHHDIRPAVELGWRTAWVRRPSDVPPSADPGSAVLETRPEGAPAPDAEIGNLRQLLDLLGLR